MNGSDQVFPGFRHLLDLTGEAPFDDGKVRGLVAPVGLVTTSAASCPSDVRTLHVLLPVVVERVF